MPWIETLVLSSAAPLAIPRVTRCSPISLSLARTVGTKPPHSSGDEKEPGSLSLSLSLDRGSCASRLLVCHKIGPGFQIESNVALSLRRHVGVSLVQVGGRRLGAGGCVLQLDAGNGARRARSSRRVGRALQATRGLFLRDDQVRHAHGQGEGLAHLPAEEDEGLRAAQGATAR